MSRSGAWSSNIAASALLAAALSGCAAPAGDVSVVAPPASVERTQDAERDLGYRPTANFGHRAAEAFEHCYYTGVLDLPEDYSGLWFKRGRDGRCRINRTRYDVFYYAPEALAGTATPVTPALEQASEARRRFVVSHEDFHDQPGVRRMPAAVKEAASTLAGLLVEWEQSSPSEDAHNGRPAAAASAFLEKARLINRSHAELKELLARYRAHKTSRREALAGKRAIFERLAAACRQRKAPDAFAVCPAAFNSAALAFEATYTSLYPEVFALYEACAWDVRRTLATLLRDVPKIPGIDTEPRAALVRLARDLRTTGGNPAGVRGEAVPSTRR